MMKKLLSIATLMLVALMLNAQAPTWTVQNTGFSTASRGIRWIDAATDQIVWCVAYDGSGGGADIRELTKTTNSGANWSPIVIPTAQIPATCGISTISAVDASTAFIAVYPVSGTTQGVYKTTNGGANFVNTTTGHFTNASSFLNNVGFWDANNGLAQGDAWGTNNIFELYTTTDGGANWVVVPDANIPNGLSAEDGWTTAFWIGTLDGNKCAFFGTNKGRIFRTTNAGVNWTTAASGFADCAGSIAFTDLNNGVAICISGADGSYLGFTRTTNGGVSWAAQTFAGTIYKAAVSAIPGYPGYYVRTGSVTGESGSQYSTDYGVTWTEIDNVDQHTEVYFYDMSHGWSGGFNQDATTGGIFKFVPGSLLGIEENTNTSKELCVYPNPNNGIFTLKNAEKSTINVYSSIGSLVYTSKVDANSYTIDLTNQAKGIYLVQVQNENVTRTLKVAVR